MNKYFRKTLLSGLFTLTLAGSFYGTNTFMEYLLPEKQETKREKRQEYNYEAKQTGESEMFKELFGGSKDIFKGIMKYLDDSTSCYGEIELKHTREQIEEIVNSVNTPKEAFERIKTDINFSVENVLLSICLLNRNMFLQQTYALRVGDCTEGAIAFAAMLSNNPEYHVRIAHLNCKDREGGHAIALYKERGKWGIVSFNDERGEKLSLFYPSEYDSIREAVAAFYPGKFKNYTLIPSTPEKLKFGKELQKKSFEDILLWLPIEDINDSDLSTDKSQE
jgi:hypothetical protein